MTTRFGAGDRDEVGARFGASAVGGGDFELVVDEQQFGSVTVLRATGATVLFDEPPAALAEVVDIVFVEQGVLDVGDPAEQQAPSGSIIVAPSWVSRRLGFADDWSAVVVRVARVAVEAFAPRLPDAIGVFTERTVFDRAVHAFVAELAHGPTSFSALEQYATEQLLTEMAGSMLLDRFGVGWSAGSPAAVLRDRAIAVIAQSRADPSLNAEAVAHAVQASLRRVQAAFADVDNSISAEIRRQRARLAKSLLTDSRYDVLSIEQVAEQSGFGTTMSLRRALAELYGTGPRELRTHRRSDSA